MAIHPVHLRLPILVGSGDLFHYRGQYPWVPVSPLIDVVSVAYQHPVLQNARVDEAMTSPSQTPDETCSARHTGHPVGDILIIMLGDKCCSARV